MDALPLTPPQLRGMGTNPECAVKSADRFLTFPSRIQVEIRNQGKVPVLKFGGYDGEPAAPAAATGTGQRQPLEILVWPATGYEARETRRLDGGRYPRRAAANRQGVETNPECALKSIDIILTSPSRIS
jgi:hypothetical protein